jgi:hypothetical protein
MVDGRFSLDCVGEVTSIPMIKDNFGRVVTFMKVDFNLLVGGRNIRSVYVKDFIQPNSVVIQGLSVALLRDCLGETGHGYRNIIRAGLESILKSALIDLDDNTLEFRLTSNNYVLCFIWNRIISTNLSYSYYVDSSSFNYNNCDCWGNLR